MCFLCDLEILLTTLLKWSNDFVNGKRNYEFDVDDQLYELSEKWSKSFEEGDLKLLYTLLDFYCDAIEHNFQSVSDGYSVSEAQADIKLIASLLSKHNYLFFNIPTDVRERMRKI